MIKYVTDRSAIIKKVLGIIEPEYTEADFNIARLCWWVNIRSSGGLGLTDAGHAAFQRANLEHYTFLVDIPLPTIYVIAMRVDRVLPGPYILRYIDRKRYITVYDSRVAMMIQLHGSFVSYLESLENSNDGTET